MSGSSALSCLKTWPQPRVNGVPVHIDGMDIQVPPYAVKALRKT